MNSQGVQYLENGKIGSRHTDVNLFMQHNYGHLCTCTQTHRHCAYIDTGRDESWGACN